MSKSQLLMVKSKLWGWWNLNVRGLNPSLCIDSCWINMKKHPSFGCFMMLRIHPQKMDSRWWNPRFWGQIIRLHHFSWVSWLCLWVDSRDPIFLGPGPRSAVLAVFANHWHQRLDTHSSSPRRLGFRVLDVYRSIMSNITHDAHTDMCV